MNLEGLSLSLLTAYLSEQLTGSKIHKIFMPAPHCLLMVLNKRQGTAYLTADSGANGPILFITDKAPENPATPPGFCMLLRKHLEGGRITAVVQNDLERVITFEVDILGASSKLITKKLIFELAGRNNNIILTQNEIIIDSLKHVDITQSSYRNILPGRAYKMPPPQTGLNILTASPEQIVEASCLNTTTAFCQKLISSTTGIGKTIAEEMLKASGIDPKAEAISTSEAKTLTANIRMLQENICYDKIATVYAAVSNANQVKFIIPLKPQLSNSVAGVKEFSDINAAINYAVNLNPAKVPSHGRLKHLVSSETGKLKRKFAALQEDLCRAEDADTQRIIADTIMANMHLLQKGAKNARLVNIYSGEAIDITLAPMLTPSENAQRYYKSYNKLKRAQTEIRLQLESTAKALTYLESIDVSLLTASSKEEIAEIQQELEDAGLIKKNDKHKAKLRLGKPTPMHIRISENTEVFIGKNNKQNDFVTFSLGSPKDLWLHTKDIPGSHVILKSKLPNVKQEEIILAAQLAAYFSKGRDGSNVPVDCTERRYVKKPSGSKPGFVIFTNQHTYYVTPDRELIHKYIP